MRQHQRHKQHTAYRLPNIHNFYKKRGVIALVMALTMAATAPFAAGQIAASRLFADTSAADQNQLPDLVLKEVSLEGDTLTVDVQNNSAVDIPEDTAGTTYIYIDDVLTWTYSWTTLGDKSFLNANGEAKIQPQTLTGEHKVGACVDATNVVTESDENNNCVYVTLGNSDAGQNDTANQTGSDPGQSNENTSLPNLVMEDVYTDDSGYITVLVGNEGDADVSSNVSGYTYIFMDGKLRSTYSWSTLSDKSFMTVGGSATIQPEVLRGEHTIKACVDPQNLVEESDETDNCLEEKLSGDSTETQDQPQDAGQEDQYNEDQYNQDQQDNNDYQGDNYDYNQSNGDQYGSENCTDGTWVSTEDGGGYCMSQQDITRSSKDAEKWLKEQTKNAARMMKESERWVSQVERDFERQLKDLEHMPNADAETVTELKAVIADAMGKVDVYTNAMADLTDTATTFLTEQQSLYADAKSSGDFMEFWTNARGYDVIWWTSEGLNAQFEHLQRKQNYGNWLLQYEQITSAYADAGATMPQELTDMKSFLDDTILTADTAFDDIVSMTEQFQALTPADLADETTAETYASLHDDLQTATEDMRDAFTAMDDAYPWDVFQGSWDDLQGAQQGQFVTDELEQIRTDIQNFIDGPLAEASAAGKDTTKLEALAEKGLEICDAIETAAADEQYDLVDTLFKKLEKLGHIAEQEASRLGMDLGNGKDVMDAKSAQQNAMMNAYGLDGNAQDLLSQIVQNVPADVLAQYVGGDTMQQLKDMLEQQAGNSSVDFKIDRFVAVTGYTDEQTASDLLEGKQALMTQVTDLSDNLDGYDALKPGMKSEVNQMLDKVAEPIFVGDAAAQAEDLVTKISDAVEALQNGEMTQTEFNEFMDKMSAEFDALKEDNKKMQWDEAGIPTDVDPVNDWSADYIMEAKDAGVMTGDKDAQGKATGTFRPGDKLGVNEWIKMMTVAGDIPTNGTTDNPYAQNDWSKSYVGGAEKAGIEYFGTESLAAVDVTKATTRSEAIGFVIDVLKKNGYEMPTVVNAASAFNDIADVDPKLQEAIAMAKELGIVGGNPDGTFKPYDVLQRDQAAKIVTNVMALLDAGTVGTDGGKEIDSFIDEVDQDLKEVDQGQAPEFNDEVPSI